MATPRSEAATEFFFGSPRGEAAMEFFLGSPRGGEAATEFFFGSPRGETADDLCSIGTLHGEAPVDFCAEGVCEVGEAYERAFALHSELEDLRKDEDWWARVYLGFMRLLRGSPALSGPPPFAVHYSEPAQAIGLVSLGREVASLASGRSPPPLPRQQEACLARCAAHFLRELLSMPAGYSVGMDRLLRGETDDES